MEVETLRWFQQVADGVTVTEVADMFHASQPGVSRGLARLEREIGAPLLRKSGRVLRMTQAGAVLKPHVDALLNQLDDGIAAVSQLLDPEKGAVSVAFHPSLGTWLVPELVRTFRSDHPGVELTLVQLPDTHERLDLDRQRIDLALTTVAGSGTGTQWRRLFSERLHLALPAGHRLAAAGPLPLAVAADEAFVLLSLPSQLRRDTDQLCERAGFRRRMALECDDLATVCGMVAAGLGVAVVPGRLPLPGSGAWTSVPLTDDGAYRQVGLAWSQDRRLLPAAQLFREHVLATAGSLR